MKDVRTVQYANGHLKIDDQGNSLGATLTKVYNTIHRGSIVEVITLMKERYASNPVDKVAGFSTLFQPGSTLISIYDGHETEAESWHRWLCTMETALIYRAWGCLESNFVQLLLTTFPLPSSSHWFPSWYQVNQHPRLDAPDLDPCSCSIKPSTCRGVPTFASGFSGLTFETIKGRIFPNCFLEKAENKYIVSQRAQDAIGFDFERHEFTLTSATPDGVLYDSGIKPPSQMLYTLVDITPGGVRRIMMRSVEPLPELPHCRIFIVCEKISHRRDECDVDNMPSLYLKRVTTLSWYYGSKPGSETCWDEAMNALDRHSTDKPCRVRLQ